jgi:DNA polymerase-3 subunit gamma/tau
MQFSLQPRLHLELGLVKLVHAGRLQSIEEAIAGLGGNEGKTPPREAASRVSAPRPAPFEARTVAQGPTRQSAGRPGPTATSSSSSLGRSSTAAEVAAPATPAHDASTPAPQLVSSEGGAPGDFKARLIEGLLEGGLNVSADALRLAEVTLNGSELRIRVSKAVQLALRSEAVTKAAQKIAGRPVKVVLETTASAAAVEERASAPEDGEFNERVFGHPGVKRFQELFPGAQVRTVRNLNE